MTRKAEYSYMRSEIPQKVAIVTDSDKVVELIRSKGIKIFPGEGYGNVNYISKKELPTGEKAFRIGGITSKDSIISLEEFLRHYEII